MLQNVYGKIKRVYGRWLDRKSLEEHHINQGMERAYVRSKYKEVWDSVSRDENTAHIAVYSSYDQKKMDEAGQSFSKTLNNHMGITHGDVVLEIGCGVGKNGKFVAPLCKKWLGTDVSANMLKHAAKNLKGVENIELIEIDGYSLSEIEDESVDIVYCSVVFMHLDEWDRYNYVVEAYRVLKPGGRVYVDNINLC